MKYLLTFLFSLLIIIPAFSQDNYYWIDGSGSWNDPAHWSLESGGTPGSDAPNETDNVVFDNSSFINTLDSVIIDGQWGETAWCKNMYWESDFNFLPTFIGEASTVLKIAGSMFLSDNMNYAFRGIIEFAGNTTQTDTIHFAGNTILNNIVFDGDDGSWILSDDLVMVNSTDFGSSVYLIEGSLNTNGKQIICGSFLSDFQTNRSLDIQNSEIRLYDENKDVWSFDGTNLTLDAGNSKIFLESGFSNFRTQNGLSQVYGDVLLNGVVDSLINTNNNVAYNNVILNKLSNVIIGDLSADSVFMDNEHASLLGTSEINVLTINSEYGIIEGDHQIGKILSNGQFIIQGSNHFGYAKLSGHSYFKGNNTFDTLILLPGTGNYYRFEAGKTQTIIDSLYIRGHPCSNITLKSSDISQLAYIKKDYGDFDVFCDYLDINSVAAESETLEFYAGANSALFPDTLTGWDFENDTTLFYGFGADTITACLGDTVILNATSFNGGIGTLYYWNGSLIPGGITYTVTEPEQVTIDVAYTEWCIMQDEVYVEFDSCENSIIESVISSKVRIYPNPSNGVFTLEINDKFNNVELSLWDMKGMELFNETIKPTARLTNRKFDFAYLKEGMYYVRLVLDSEIVCKKVVVR